MHRHIVANLAVLQHVWCDMFNVACCYDLTFHRRLTIALGSWLAALVLTTLVFAALPCFGASRRCRTPSCCCRTFREKATVGQ